MTEKQEAYIEYIITSLANYLKRMANHPKKIDGRYLIQEKTLAALRRDFYANKANLTSRQASQIISALNAYSPRNRVEQILRLTFLENVKHLKNHLVIKGINPSNLSLVRHQVTPETLVGVQTVDPQDPVDLVDPVDQVSS